MPVKMRDASMIKKKTVRRRAKTASKRRKKTVPVKRKASATKRKASRAKRRTAGVSSKRQGSRSAGKKSERVVVDEIMENGRARILRAPRLPKASRTDLGIDTWGDEVEEAITVWKLEAYVGFKAPRKLKEGDVFFLRDGSSLNETYVGPKVIARDKAADEHLIEAADESREQARNEIKERFYNLTAQRAGRNKKDRDRLSKIIRMRVWKGKR
jgi:hypothetical protein